MNVKKAFVSTNSRLLAEWDKQKNEKLGLSPDGLTLGSTKKPWWKCSQDHSWQAAIYSRANGSGCPYCSGQKAWRGFNDLVTRFPDLRNEWDKEKNFPVTPYDVTAGSNKRVWWKCQRKHSWQAAISSRTKGVGCPFCSGQRVFKGFNDFGSRYPELAKEWNYKKNGDITPFDITIGSGKKIWWKCANCNYEWRSCPGDRIRGSVCPACSPAHTSLSQYIVFFYISIAYSSARINDRSQGVELDVYIPRKKIGIEYDGVYYHKDKKRGLSDNTKDALCKDKGIKLIRIREKGLPETTSAYNIFRNNNESIDALGEAIVELFRVLKCTNRVNVNIERDFNRIYKAYRSIKAKDSLAVLFPEIAEEWSIRKNGDILPTNISAHSHIKGWWKCIQGHEWEASVHSRTGRGGRCPYCSGQRAIKGENDLATLRPDLVKEWNYRRNGTSKPEDFKLGSGQPAWWICSNCAYEWQSIIGNRVKGVGCPRCADKKRRITTVHNKLKKGELSLEEQYPEIAKEWDYKRNTILPSMVLPKSSKIVWWICPKGHHWKGVISKRSIGRNCPVCANRQVVRGVNDLATTNKSLSKEWHPTKNGNITPNDVVAQSSKKAWWKCNRGHEWEAAINSRNMGRGCPFCANKKVLTGYNDLATTEPALAKEWHPTMNDELLPTQFTRGSGKKVWWACNEGHTWEATICNRSKGKGCPYCVKKKLYKNLGGSIN